MEKLKYRLVILLKFLACWMLLYMLCILCRLPHFLSEKMFIDIDEATIGIMAKDVLSGKPIPYYFYFQNYGFSTVETLVTAGFIKIFGPGIWALKLAGLFMFSFAGAFLMQFLFDSKVKLIVCVCALIIISCFPPWYIWGALMRGGYLTAFVCSTVVFYITQSKLNNYRLVALTGFLFYIAYESQILIFLPVLPLLIYWIASGNRKVIKMFLFGCVFLVPLLLGRHFFVSQYLGSVKAIVTSDKIADSLTMCSEFFLESFTSFYSYSVVFDIPQYWNILSIILLIAIGIFITARFKKNQTLIIVLLLLGTFMSFSVSLFGESFSPRYLIGFFSGLLFIIIVCFKSEFDLFSKLIIVLISSISIIGTSVGSKISRHWINSNGNEISEMRELYNEIKNRKIEAVYSIDRTFVWNYLYGDEIPSTNICGFDRSPRFLSHLNSLKKRGAKIGLFGNFGFQNEIFDAKEDLYLSNKYYLIDTVSDSLLDATKSIYCK